MGHPCLGIAHGCGWIPFDGTKVTLAFDQGITHGPWLSHVNQGRVDGLISVRVIVTHGFPNNFGTLDVLLAGADSEIIHGVENTSLRGFEPIAHIRQGARYDHRHGIVEE